MQEATIMNVSHTVLATHSILQLSWNNSRVAALEQNHGFALLSSQGER